MIIGFDASRPPSVWPRGKKVLFFYLFGNTPHVWTRAETAKYGKRKKIPIVVPPQATGGHIGASVFAFEVLRALYEYGVPKGSPVVIDMETKVDVAFVNHFWRILRWAGYRVWVYGSANTVFGNPACNGYWVADYKGTGPYMYVHKHDRATQYASNTVYDSDTIKPLQYYLHVKKW